MPLLDITPGTPVYWGIGNRAARTFDNHPGILLRFGPGIDDQGREGDVASMLILRPRLDGTKYLDAVKVLEQYVDPRFESVVGLDATEDGEALTLADVMRAYGQQKVDFFTNPIEVGEPEAVPATSKSKATSASTSDLPI